MKTSVRTLLFMLLMALVSCSGNQGAKALMERVDSLMEENPEAALALLDSAEVASYEYPHGQKMRYELLRAKAMNKAYVDFTSDSVMKEVVEYYDAHGTANEKVEAHYLLGCVYRDLHESPAALNCYYDAVECADTLSEDCDYRMLMRVYGQMAKTFENQIMPYEELDALEKYTQCAILAKDTFNSIVGKELSINAYTLIGDTARILQTTSEIYDMYIDAGYTKEASVVYPIAIAIYLDKGEYSKADSLMCKYETESELLNDKGEIRSGKEHYYYSKGMYNIGIGKTDSAEYYFRKLSQYGFEHDANKGLLKVYQKIGNIDSVMKFSTLKEELLDNELSTKLTDAMYQAKGMYDYSRNQRIATEKSYEAAKNRNRALIILFIFLFAVFVSIIVFNRYRTKKKYEIEKLLFIQKENESEYYRAVEELRTMEASFENYKEQKLEKIEILQQQIKEFNTNSDKLNNQSIEAFELRNEITEMLKEKLCIKPNYEVKILKKERKIINSYFKKYHTSFYMFVTDNSVLTNQEIDIVILSRLGLSTSDIAILLNTQNSRVSNAKNNINKKVFNENSARSFIKNINSL